ncbi:MAG: hypothetical protein M5U01_39165 [Ardenticatenaceae bacterium]|nr:hypothetical protein [Ardenticatenaceae bacterium]
MRREWPVILVSVALLALGLSHFASPKPATAAACIWTGGAGSNWGTSGNWTGCNGASGNEPPAAGDTVTIGSALNQPTITGASVTVASLALTSGASLTIASGAALTVNGDITLSADGGATTTIDNAGTVEATAGILKTNNSNSTGTAQFALHGSGAWTLQNVTTYSITSLTIVDGPSIRIRGNVSRAGILDPGTSTIVFDSGGSQSLSGNSDHNFYNLEIGSGTTVNHASGSGALRIRNSFTNNGTLSQTSTSANRRLQFDYDALDYPTSNLSGSGSTTVARVEIVSNKTVNAGGHSITINNNTYNSALRVPWTNNGTFNGGTATVTFNGDSSAAMDGIGVNNFNHVVIANTLNAGSADLNVAGNWTNNGIFGAGTSTVTFDGGSTSTYGGSSTTTFNNLAVSPGTALDVGANALFNVASTMTNDGTLRQTQTANGGTVAFLNVTDGGATARYYGVDITPNGSLGSTTVAVSGNQVCSQATGSPVRRCFEISPTSVVSSAVTFYFRDAELQAGQTLDSLQIWHYNGAGWDQVTKGATGGSGEGNFVQGLDISSFSPFALKNSSPLAVTVAAFRAALHEDHILVTWETVSELDLRGFNLYRAGSRAGPWTRLNRGLIGSQRPGSPEGSSYQWEDSDVSAGTAYVYRLEAISLDGTPSTAGMTEATTRLGLRLWLPLVARQ